MTETESVSKDYARKLFLAGRSHGMGAIRLWTWALEEGNNVNPDNPTLFAFNGPLSLPIHHLAGLSFELLLKAAYVAHGAPPDDKHLQKAIGHDLVAALDLAEQQGFATDAPHLRKIIEHWREPYAKHYFRYQWPEAYPLPEFQQVRDALVALEEDVEALFVGLVGEEETAAPL